MFDPTKPARTRSGLEVEILPRRLANYPFPLIGIVKYPSEMEMVHTFKEDGRNNFVGDSDLDLENIPERVVRWANVYPINEGSFELGLFSLKPVDNPSRIAQLEFLFEDNKLLSVKVHK